MKTRGLKLFVLLFLVSSSQIHLTRSSFTATSAVENNRVSARCWAAPSAPNLSSPSNNTYSKNSGVTFSWNPSTSSCPIAVVAYKFEAYDNSNLTGPPIYSSDWIPGTSFPVSSMSDGVYSWRVSAQDQYGNEMTSAVWTLTVDTVKPVSIITTPLNPGSDNTVYTLFWNGDITGTAADSGSGVDHVELSIHRLILDLFWNSTNWISGTESTVRVPATGTSTWSYSLPNPHIGVFLITSHAVDKAGNVENSYSITVVNDEPDQTTEKISTPTPTPEPTEEISPTPTSEPTPTDTPTPTPTIEPSPTDTPTPTPEITDTPAPTETPTETPAPTPEP